jgi:stearoyl-CoA desaturase (delta-9 desaturase)
MREVLNNSKVLDTVYSMRKELTALWQRSTATKEQLVHQLEDWCHRAEASGIIALQEFSRRLRCYQLARA